MAAPPATPGMSLDEFVKNRISVWWHLRTDFGHPELSSDDERVLREELVFTP